MLLRLKDNTEIEIDRCVREIGNYNGRQCRLEITPTYESGIFDAVAEKLTDDNVSKFSIENGEEVTEYEGFSFESIREICDGNSGNAVLVRLVKSLSGSKANSTDEVEIPEGNSEEA